MVRKPLSELQNYVSDLFELNGCQADYRMPLSTPQTIGGGKTTDTRDYFGTLELDGQNVYIQCNNTNNTRIPVPRRHWMHVMVTYAGNPYLKD